MSEIGDEFNSNSTDDFGYKSLGESIQLITDYEEKLPFKHINNLTYATHKGLFAAAGSEKIVLGTLADLKADIENSKERFETNRHEVAISNVTSVGFTRDENYLIVGTGNLLQIASISDYTQLSTNDFKSIAFDEEVDFFIASPTNASKIAVLNTNGNLTLLDISTQSKDVIAQQVLNFSWSPKGKQIVITLQDGSIKQITLSGEVKVTIPRPDDLTEEELLPLSIVWLSSLKFFAIYGEIPQEVDGEEPSYDFKTFIINHDKTTKQNVFQENFDAIPAFGSVLRKPTVYSSTLHNLSNSLPILTLTASSTSVEISGIAESEIILPELDQARAALPINDDTGNDVNAIGLFTDISTTGKIEEPCVGVSEAEWLPSVWVLGHDGRIQGWYVFHVHDLKNGSLKQDGVKQYEDDLFKAAIEGGTVGGTPVKADPVSVPLKQETKPAFGSSTFGQSSESKTTGFGSSGFGSSGFSQQTGDKPAFGSSGFGQSTENKPAFGSSGFGTSSFGQSTENKPAFGSSAFGQSTENKPAFGSSGFGTSSFGQSTVNKPAFGSSGFGSSAFGQSTENKPAFGSSGFGSSAFGQSTENKPAFGSSGFGSSAFGQSTENKPAFGSSGFGQFSFGNSAFGSDKTATSDSPFANLTKKDETKPDRPFVSFGKVEEKKSESPFASLGFSKDTKSDSPFGGITKNETTSSLGASPGENKSLFGDNYPEETPSSSLFGENKPDTFSSMDKDLGGSLFGASEPSKIKVPGLSDDEDEKSDSDLDNDSDSDEEESTVTENFVDPSTAPNQPTGPTSFGNVSFGSTTPGSGFGSTGFGSSGFGNTGFKFGQKPQKPVSDKKEEQVETPKLGGFGQFATDNKLSLLKGKNVFETFEPHKDDEKEVSKETETTNGPEIPEVAKENKKPVTSKEPNLSENEESFKESQVEEEQEQSEDDDNESEADQTKDADDFAKFDEEEWIDSDEPETANEQQEGEEEEEEGDEEEEEEEEEGEEEEEEGEEGGDEEEDEEQQDATQPIDSSFDRSETHDTTQDEADRLGEEIDEALKLEEKKEDPQANELSDEIGKNLNIGGEAASTKEATQNKDDNEFEHIKTEDGKESSSLDSLRDKEEEDLYEEVKSQNVEHDGADKVERTIQAVPVQMKDSEAQTFIPTKDAAVSSIINLKDSGVQAEVKETKSIALKTFEDDEAYFGSFFVPPEVPAYQYLGDVKYPKLSSDPIFSQLEKIYYDTQAEITIIEENCTNIGLFIDEHLKEEPVHTEESLGHAHHWRLSEATTVNKIIQDKAKAAGELKNDISTEHTNIKSIQETIDTLDKEALRIREKFLALEKLSDKAILNARELPVEVLILQDQIRKKNAQVASDLRLSEQKIMSLKTATNIFYNEPPTPAALYSIINHINSITRDYSKETRQLTEQIAKLNTNHAKILQQLNEGKTESFQDSEWEHRSLTKLKVADLNKRRQAKRAINEALRQRSANSVTLDV